MTFLLVLKIGDEQAKPPFNLPSPDGLRRAGKPSPIPNGKDWLALPAKDGDELEIRFRQTLEDPGKRSGVLGAIFRRLRHFTGLRSSFRLRLFGELI